MKMRTKVMLAFLVALSLVDMVEVYFGWLPLRDCVISLVSVWFVVPLWELFVSKGLEND